MLKTLNRNRGIQDNTTRIIYHKEKNLNSFTPNCLETERGKSKRETDNTDVLSVYSQPWQFPSEEIKMRGGKHTHWKDAEPQQTRHSAGLSKYSGSENYCAVDRFQGELFWTR